MITSKIRQSSQKTSEAEDEGGSEIKEWRRKFWKQLCDYAAQKDTPVRFNKPSSENYLNVSRNLIDLTGFRMNVWLGKENRKIAIRLYMSKQNFDILEEQQKKIEQEFCESLEWEKSPQRRESRISLRKDISDPTDESDWENHHEWVISKLEKFHKKFNEVFPRNPFNSSQHEEQPPQPVRPVYERKTLPTAKEMEQPALELLADRREYRRVEIINCLTEYFSLTNDARSYLSKTGQAEKHLVNKGLIQRTRTGFYRITADGLEVLHQDEADEDNVFSSEVDRKSQNYSQSPAKSPKSQRKWRRPGAVAALRDPAEIQEAEAKIARILNPSEKARLERELHEAKRTVNGS